MYYILRACCVSNVTNSNKRRRIFDWFVILYYFLYFQHLFQFVKYQIWQKSGGLPLAPLALPHPLSLGPGFGFCKVYCLTECFCKTQWFPFLRFSTERQNQLAAIHIRWNNSSEYFRSSRSQMFFKVGTLKKLALLTENICVEVSL